MSPIAGQLVTETFDYDGGRQVTAYVPGRDAQRASAHYLVAGEQEPFFLENRSGGRARSATPAPTWS
jgi:hypothetical protein